MKTMKTIQEYTLSFPLAVIISINAIVGAGLFVNAAPLSGLAGPLCTISYIVVSLFMVPLVLVIAESASLYPATQGGLYTYIEKGIGRNWALFGIGCYFLAKATSCSILLQTALLYLQKSFSLLDQFSLQLLIISAIAIIGVSNAWGVKFGARLQFLFMLLKAIPIVLVVVSAWYFFHGSYFKIVHPFPVKNFLSSLPIALYALMGFETCCSIGHLIKGGSRALHKIILISFFTVAAIATFFQAALYGAFGPSLAYLSAPLSNYFKLFTTTSFPSSLTLLGNLCIALSVLGACYGIIYANTWNGDMFGDALKKCPFGKWLTQKNSAAIPYNSLLLQLWVIWGFALSNCSVLVRARLAVIGISTCYFLVAIGLFNAYKNQEKKPQLAQWITVLSFGSCLYIIGMCIKDLLFLRS